MPTNKLWIEHTEKAAWDSVQALRDKIAEAERRIERLGPPIAAWRPLLDQLDQARNDLGLDDADYVDVLRRLLERAAHDRQRLEEHEHEHEREHEVRAPQREQPIDVTELMQRPVRASFDDDDDYFDSQPHRIEQAERDLRERRRELLDDGTLPDDVDALLRLIDAKVADLGDAEGEALSSAALDLGVLALALAAQNDDE